MLNVVFLSFGHAKEAKNPLRQWDERMNMHFSVPDEALCSTDSQWNSKNSTETDEREASGRPIIRGEERTQQRGRKQEKVGLAAAQTGQMLHKTSVVKKKTDLQDSLNYSQQDRANLHRLFSNPVISSLPISFCATARYQTFLIFRSRLTILLSDEAENCFVRSWLQILRSTSERLGVASPLYSPARCGGNQSGGDTVGGNDWSTFHVRL